MDGWIDNDTVEHAQATGDDSAVVHDRDLRRQQPRARGFTLLEILIVITIIGILAALLIPYMGSVVDGPPLPKTKVMIEAIASALEAYYAEFRDYPPDGFDVLDGANAQGVEVNAINKTSRTTDPSQAKERRRNSACLIYFLMLRHQKVSRYGPDVSMTSASRKRTKLVGPFLPEGSLGRQHFSLHKPDGSPDFTNPLCEIVDAFGFPIEYDKVQTVDQLTVRDGNPSQFHAAEGLDLATARVLVDENLCPSGAHSLIENANDIRDPRRAVAWFDGCITTSGPVRSSNVGAFDVWAHNFGWTNPRDDIGNFTVK